MAHETISEFWDAPSDLDRRIASFDKKIEAVFKASEPCQRIARIKGVGPKTATALVAAVGDATDFRNGRRMTAWLGLVPRQFSSGDRTVLMASPSEEAGICAAFSSTAPAPSSERPGTRTTP